MNVTKIKLNHLEFTELDQPVRIEGRQLTFYPRGLTFSDLQELEFYIYTFVGSLEATVEFPDPQNPAGDKLTHTFSYSQPYFNQFDYSFSQEGEFIPKLGFEFLRGNL